MNPQLFTVATLTGHVVRAYGPGYSAAMDNGPARSLGTATLLAKVGDEWGDPVEVSTVRREDYALVKSNYPTEDIIQVGIRSA